MSNELTSQKKDAEETIQLSGVHKIGVVNTRIGRVEILAQRDIVEGDLTVRAYQGSKEILKLSRSTPVDCLVENDQFLLRDQRPENEGVLNDILASHIFSEVSHNYRALRINDLHLVPPLEAFHKLGKEVARIRYIETVQARAAQELASTFMPGSNKEAKNSNVIDIKHRSLDEITKVYTETFPDLPQEVCLGDIVMHICDLIRSSNPLKLVVVRDDKTGETTVTSNSNMPTEVLLLTKSADPRDYEDSDFFEPDGWGDAFVGHRSEAILVDPDKVVTAFGALEDKENCSDLKMLG